MGVTPETGNAILLCLNQGRSGSAKRVKEKVTGPQTESLRVLPDEMRRKGKDESVPPVNRFIISQKRIDPTSTGL